MLIPTDRRSALSLLASFVPNAGPVYTARRNFDTPDTPTVSGLSPYIRHRIITEEEVLNAVLAQHLPHEAAKFIDEVFWRAYWKGWMELRPSVWSAYKTGVSHSFNRIQTEAGLRANWEAACNGETGIEGFDDWAKQLVATGWLHNHARMWFASIWIFTLELPWELGADFFLRHLIDGDPASNTLSWRWVAGLHTQGKTYLATPDNIARFTQNRYRPTGLATKTIPVDGEPNPKPGHLRPASPLPNGSFGLLATIEDLSPSWIGQPEASAVFLPKERGPLLASPLVNDWRRAAITQAIEGPILQTVEDVADWAAAQGFDTIATPYAPVGPVADALKKLKPALSERGIALFTPMRDYDRRAWPNATKGFFKFREAIPDLLAAL